MNKKMTPVNHRHPNPDAGEYLEYRAHKPRSGTSPIVSVRLPGDYGQRLAAIANKRGVTMASIARNLVMSYVNKHYKPTTD